MGDDGKLAAPVAVPVRGGDPVLATQPAAVGAAVAVVFVGSGPEPMVLLGLLVAVLVALMHFEMRTAAQGRHRGAAPVGPPRLSETT